MQRATTTHTDPFAGSDDLEQIPAMFLPQPEQCFGQPSSAFRQSAQCRREELAAAARTGIRVISEEEFLLSAKV